MFLDYLIIYSKSNEPGKEKDEQRRVKLEMKRMGAKEAAAVLAEKSESVKALVQARTLAAAKKVPSSVAPAIGAADGGVGAAGTKRPRDDTSAPTATNSADMAPGSKPAATRDAGKKGKKTTAMPSPVSLADLRNQQPKFYMKRRIAKIFDGQMYFGAVKKWVPAYQNDEGVDLWLIEYDDGDAEDMERNELMEGFELWYNNSSRDIVYQTTQRELSQKS